MHIILILLCSCYRLGTYSFSVPLLPVTCVQLIFCSVGLLSISNSTQRSFFRSLFTTDLKDRLHKQHTRERNQWPAHWSSSSFTIRLSLFLQLISALLLSACVIFLHSHFSNNIFLPVNLLAQLIWGWETFPLHTVSPRSIFSCLFLSFFFLSFFLTRTLFITLCAALSLSHENTAVNE